MESEEHERESWEYAKHAWWEFLLHNEKTISDRTNFFLLAESFFVAAVVALVASDKIEFYAFPYFLLNLIAFGALSISVSWYFLGQQIYRRQGVVRDVKVRAFFQEFTDELDRYKSPISSNRLLTMGLPGIFIFGWLLALAAIHCVL